MEEAGRGGEGAGPCWAGARVAEQGPEPVPALRPLPSFCYAGRGALEAVRPSGAQALSVPWLWGHQPRGGGPGGRLGPTPRLRTFPDASGPSEIRRAWTDPRAPDRDSLPRVWEPRQSPCPRAPRGRPSKDGSAKPVLSQDTCRRPGVVAESSMTHGLLAFESLESRRHMGLQGPSTLGVQALSAHKLALAGRDCCYRWWWRWWAPAGPPLRALSASPGCPLPPMASLPVHAISSPPCVRCPPTPLPRVPAVPRRPLRCVLIVPQWCPLSLDGLSPGSPLPPTASLPGARCPPMACPPVVSVVSKRPLP